MAKDQRKINLIPNRGDSIVSQFFSWIFTIGRLLIILTETLALAVFLYRFSLDMRISDLHDQIKNASIIVQNFKSGEDTYRNLQTRLAFAKQYDSTSDQTVKILQDILALGKGKVTFKEILVTTSNIELQIQSTSPTNLSNFVLALKAYPSVVSVSVNHVENKTSSALTTVSISAPLQVSNTGPRIPIAPESESLNE